MLHWQLTRQTGGILYTGRHHQVGQIVNFELSFTDLGTDTFLHQPSETMWDVCQPISADFDFFKCATADSFSVYMLASRWFYPGPEANIVWII